MKIKLHENIEVVTLYYINIIRDEPKAEFDEDGTEVVRICFARNRIEFNAGDRVYSFMDIDAKTLKYLYDLNNKNVCENLRIIFRKGWYKEHFATELREWYISMRLGDTWTQHN